MSRYAALFEKKGFGGRFLEEVMRMSGGLSSEYTLVSRWR